LAKIEKVYDKLKLIIEKDSRYALNAYQFVFEALSYTAKYLGKDVDSSKEEERHIDGHQLLEGIRKYALDEYGFMTLTLFNIWGIKTDTDFGEIVFTLVENGLMGKTEKDSSDDFKDVYDFNKVFNDDFKFENTFDIKMEWDTAGKVKIK
jgi:uncharacterized repeat protein (TIGR04138 family)